MRPVRWIAVTLLCAALVGAPSARAETRSHLEGDLRPAGAFVSGFSGLFNAPGAAVGTFTLDASAPELDFRSAPGALVLTTPSGSLTARAADPVTLFGVLPRDADSGRPLKADAPEGATCATGAEPDCWQLGDPIPEDAAVADAFAPFLAAPTSLATTSSTGGIDLTAVEASVLLQSWPTFTQTQPALPYVWINTDSADAGLTVRSYGGRMLLPGATVRIAPFGALTQSLEPPSNTFQTEMAALSWNMLMLLVSMSGDGLPPTEIYEFDPANPMDPGRCSFATPQYCSSVASLFLFYAALLDDDPLAPPTARAIWQAGALYTVTETGGDLAAYAGGTVHVLGLERARAHVATLGIPLVLFPAGATLDPSTPFAVPTPAAPSFGLAYATAPEPSAGALAAVVGGALAALRRRARR